jgi:hypothetical protein
MSDFCVNLNDFLLFWFWRVFIKVVVFITPLRNTGNMHAAFLFVTLFYLADDSTAIQETQP